MNDVMMNNGIVPIQKQTNKQTKKKKQGNSQTTHLAFYGSSPGGTRM